jgi:hypothetical protein
MVRAAPPVRPTRLRLGPGRQRDHPMCRAPRRNQDGAPNMIAHRGAALKAFRHPYSPRGFQTPIFPQRLSDTHVPPGAFRGFQTPMFPHVPSETKRFKPAPRGRSFFVGYLTRKSDLVLLSITVVMTTI